MKRASAADFLQNMVHQTAEPKAPAAPEIRSATRVAGVASRAGRKHIGGYLDDLTVEKVAVLRARLKLDNSELIKRAIDELYLKHTAKRAFGDL